MLSSRRKILAASLCLFLTAALGVYWLTNRTENAAVGLCPKVGTMPMPIVCEPDPDLS